MARRNSSSSPSSGQYWRFVFRLGLGPSLALPCRKDCFAKSWTDLEKTKESLHGHGYGAKVKPEATDTTRGHQTESKLSVQRPSDEGVSERLRLARLPTWERSRRWLGQLRSAGWWPGPPLSACERGLVFGKGRSLCCLGRLLRGRPGLSLGI